MKRRYWMLIVLLLFVINSGCLKKDKDIIFQVSTITTLLDGGYDGVLSFRDLKKQGDFGIGTFNALDGEMIAVDGEFYQIKSDGNVYSVAADVLTPFAIVTDFTADKTLEINEVVTLQKLKEILDKNLKDKNIFYAIKILGEFTLIKTRSVPRQEKPFKPLVDIVKNQPVFEYKNIKGTLVGFWCPLFIKGVNVPSYHFHFISEDKKVGGHLLDLEIKKVVINIDETSDFFMKLPENINLKDRQKLENEWVMVEK
jgi:acetolactate decarboxylase